MKDYISVSDAVNDLKKRGYDADFEFEKQNFCLYCEDLEMTLDPEDFHVDEVHRFQGNAGSDQNSILFAITSSTGVRGILVDQYTTHLAPLIEKI
jgi:hypothetical protein